MPDQPVKEQPVILQFIVDGKVVSAVLLSRLSTPSEAPAPNTTNDNSPGTIIAGKLYGPRPGRLSLDERQS
jgi:hypothetical protein